MWHYSEFDSYILSFAVREQVTNLLDKIILKVKAGGLLIFIPTQQ